MTKEVEDIIKNKAFADLTPDERKRVGELAENEEEYVQLQWFLTAAASSFESSKISASPASKKRVMEHLTAAGDKKGFWLNSIGVFMLPTKGKAFYKKPLFQLGIAAALVVGFLVYFNATLPENNLAVNEPIQEEIVNSMPTNPDAPRDNSTHLQNHDTTPDFETKNEEKPAKFDWNKEKEMRTYRDGLKDGSGQFLLEDAVMESSELAEQIPIGVASEMAEESDEMLTEKQVYVAPVVTNESRADRHRTEALMDMEQEKDLKKAETSATEGLSSGNTFNTSGVGSIANSQEEIIPKSLHIDKTKELNQLFFIVK